MIWNKAKWDSLSESQKALVQASCDSATLMGFARSEYEQFAAMKEIEKKGVKLVMWDDKFLKVFEKAWDEVAQEQAQKSPAFKEAWESLKAFRADYAVWRERGYLK
jgi:TRAP-type mannitol/chloroaromatic compound transport system substrate-binding protein